MPTFGNPILHRLGATKFWKITDYPLINKHSSLQRFALYRFLYELLLYFLFRIRADFFVNCARFNRFYIKYPDFFKEARFISRFFFKRLPVVKVVRKKHKRSGTARRLIGYSEHKKKKFLYRRFLYTTKKEERTSSITPLLPISVPFFYMPYTFTTSVFGFNQETLLLSGQLTLMLKTNYNYSMVRFFSIFFIQRRLEELSKLLLERDWRFRYYKKLRKIRVHKNRRYKGRQLNRYKNKNHRSTFFNKRSRNIRRRRKHRLPLSHLQYRRWLKRIELNYRKIKAFGGRKFRRFWFLRWRFRRNVFALPEFQSLYFKTTTLDYFNNIFSILKRGKRRLKSLAKGLHLFFCRKNLFLNKFKIIIKRLLRIYKNIYLRQLRLIGKKKRLKKKITKLKLKIRKLRLLFKNKLSDMIYKIKKIYKYFIRHKQALKRRFQAATKIAAFSSLYSTTSSGQLYKFLKFYGLTLLGKKESVFLNKWRAFKAKLETYIFLMRFIWILLFRQQFAKLAARSIKEQGFKKLKWRFDLLWRFKFNAATFVYYLLDRLNTGSLVHQVFEHAKQVLGRLSKRERQISGYKLCFSGRFTRRQIATFRWVQKGVLHLSNRASLIDYAFNTGTTRHGSFGIKVWLCQKSIADPFRR